MLTVAAILDKQQCVYCSVAADWPSYKVPTNRAMGYISLKIRVWNKFRNEIPGQNKRDQIVQCNKL